MTLNHITSPYIYSYDASNVWQKGLDSLEIGFTYRIPMGLRFNLGDFGSMFIEVRPTSNSFSFDRGIKSEKDSVTMNTNLILLGYTCKFGTSSANK